MTDIVDRAKQALERIDDDSEPRNPNMCAVLDPKQSEWYFVSDGLVEELVAEVERLTAAVERIHAEHHKVTIPIGDYCYTCSTPWPCRIERALQGGAA